MKAAAVMEIALQQALFSSGLEKCLGLDIALQQGLEEFLGLVAEQCQSLQLPLQHVPET